jgi:hypothetical protein
VVCALIGITRQAHRTGAARTTRKALQIAMIPIELLFANEHKSPLQSLVRSGQQSPMQPGAFGKRGMITSSTTMYLLLWLGSSVS